MVLFWCYYHYVSVDYSVNYFLQNTMANNLHRPLEPSCDIPQNLHEEFDNEEQCVEGGNDTQTFSDSSTAWCCDGEDSELDDSSLLGDEDEDEVVATCDPNHVPAVGSKSFGPAPLYKVPDITPNNEDGIFADDRDDKEAKSSSSVPVHYPIIPVILVIL